MSYSCNVCGIVGYVGERNARDLLIAGLRRLEYRGYDSAGVAVLSGGEVHLARSVGNLDALAAKLDGATGLEAEQGGAVAAADGAAMDTACTGIGHTRWATHGRVSEANAHPHFDSDGRIHVVVNGIIENYVVLKEQLLRGGCHFSSETDAEVIAHLISESYAGDLSEAVRSAYGRLQGHFAFVAMCAEEPEVIVGARRECPLVIGRGEGEQFIASAASAFLGQTRLVQHVEDGEIAVLRKQGVELSDADGRPVARAAQRVDWDDEAIEKGGFESFMLKEIYEQADALAETISGHLQGDDGVQLGLEGQLREVDLADASRIVIVACGTSYHAGLVGRYVIEKWARVPVELDIASEYRYRDAVLNEGDLVIGISQSGETADTLAAMRNARERGARVLAITNVVGSQATRDCDGVLYTQAGIEIGVAATKTFVCQVAVIYLLALRLAELRATMAQERLRELALELRSLPHRIAEVLGSHEAASLSRTRLAVQRIAREHGSQEFFLYIGRNVGLPVALEGALKLKEIAYIATDAYAAGEMKHGPIALLDSSTPVICIATDSPVLEKLISNMQEVRARGAHVIALASAGNAAIREHVEELIELPHVDEMLQPVLAVVPLQMLAYEIARQRGLNVDQPRNLAKTVTVE